MQILKGMALGLVCFFLFMALLLLGLVWTINNTVLNPQFMVNEVNSLDITGVAHDILIDQIPAEDSAYVPAMDNILIEIKPWINQQIHSVIYTAYDYLLGKVSKLNISIPTGDIRQSVVNNFTAAYLKNPPKEYTQIPASDRPRVLANFQNQLGDAIPGNWDINAEVIGTEGMQNLQEARDVIGYFHFGYFALIGVCVLLVLLVILILREVKGTTRSLGFVCLISGLLSAAAFSFAKYILPRAISLSDLPTQLQTWIPKLIGDLLSPWGLFSLILVIGGIILLGFSIYAGRNVHNEAKPA